MGFALPRNLWPQREPDFDPPGVIPGWLPRMADRVAWVLIFSLMYFLWLWTLEIAGDRATPLKLGEAGLWTLNVDFYWPLLVGFIASAIGLPMLAKIGIPIYCELAYKRPGQGWPKFWTLVLIVLTSFVLIAGNLHVINGARLEKNRDGAVKLEQADQGRAALQANLDSINADLKDITNPALTTYQAQASREGAAAWAKRVATAKAQNDWQADAIERALASAERGDQLRKDRATAILALAAAPTRAANVDRVVKAGDWATNITDELDKARALMLSVVQDLAALLLGWIAYRLDAVRKQQLADWEAVHSSPVADAGIDLRIDDHSNETQVRPQETILEEDPETGELVEKIRVRYKNEDYFRKKPTRKPRARKDDPRAPAANEVELQGEDEVGDVAEEQGYQAQIELEALHDPDIRSGFGEAALEQPDAYGNAGDAGSSLGAGSRIDSIEAEGDLTHAQEDQQDYEPEAAALGNDGEGEVGFEDVREAAEMASSDGDQGRDEPLGGSGPLLDDADSEPQDSLESLTQTLLPNNEGVLVGTPIIPDDEADALNEEFAARRAAAEAAE